MNQVQFQRARNQDQIAERRDEIVATARQLSLEFGVMKWSLNELGRRTSTSKANLYRYFGSKEEVLLHLHVLEAISYTLAFEQRAGSKALEIEQLAQIITDEISQRPLYCELLSLSACVLEHNASIEAQKDNKLMLKELTYRQAKVFEQALPWIGHYQALTVNGSLFIYTAGLWPMAHPASATKELITSSEELACIDFSFETQLYSFLTAQLKGCKYGFITDLLKEEKAEGN